MSLPSIFDLIRDETGVRHYVGAMDMTPQQGERATRREAPRYGV